NLSNGVKIDDQPDKSVLEQNKQQSDDAVIATAHWGEDGIYWRWSDGGVEATAFALQALLTVDPKNKLIEPVTNWLIKNRRGAQWSNTRDTAITILSLNQYLRKSGELQSEMEYELYVNNNLIANKKITPEQVFSAPSSFEIDRRYLKDGINEIYIKRRKGKGPLYFSAQAKFFSLEEPITAAGNEIFVSRQYYKLVGRPTLLKGYVYDKQPLNDGQTISSGERVEAVITIEAKNNYEYLVFEDLKPAGFEAVEVRSGGSLYAKELKSGALDYTGRTRWVYQELRDRKVALFVDKLPEGVWEIRYDLRAETPGEFHALPVMGYAMYVPEIRANSREVRLTVKDKE
ncbi:MAG: alpha-2-macroglobulin, partial [Elusimicrobia bacterium]|nr:alpha-2-macroglobulin [Elusimicrobiota bacterium]